MKVSIFDKDALAAIPPRSLRAYLLFEGWEKVDVFGKYSEVYSKVFGSGQSGEVVIPFTRDIFDYEAAVGDVVQYLSIVEERSELAVYDDLTKSDQDVIRVRAPDSDEYGSISVGSGVELVQYSRDLLASAACAAYEPRRAYHLKKVVQAEEYMRRVRLGQTERGSFIVTIMTPVPPLLSLRSQYSLWPHIDDEPYERRVTRVLIEALNAAQEAITHSNRGHGLEAFIGAVPKGVSANLCESVAAIIEEADEADLSVTWARTRPTPDPRANIRFRNTDAVILREAAREMRLQEPRRDEFILGYVTNLRRDKDAGEGTVIIKTFIEEKVRSLHAKLPEADYNKAIRAHQKQAPISVIGDVEKTGQRWHLTDIRDLNIVDEDDQLSLDERDDKKIP